jgi:hypothetical protein
MVGEVDETEAVLFQFFKIRETDQNEPFPGSLQTEEEATGASP